MRIRRRIVLQATLLSCLAAGVIVPDAMAGSVVNVTFAGKVNPALPGIAFPANVMAGDPVYNSYFSYNTGSFSGNSTTGVYTLNGLNPLAQGFSLNINTSPSSPTLWSDVYAGSPAAFTIKMTGSSSPGATLDLHLSTASGTTKPGEFVDLFLTSTTYVGKALPTATTIGAFLNTAATLTWDPPGTASAMGFTATINVFNGVEVPGGQAVPEPSSLILALVAIGTATGGFLISRRPAKTVS